MRGDDLQYDSIYHLSIALQLGAIGTWYKKYTYFTDIYMHVKYLWACYRGNDYSLQ